MRHKFLVITVKNSWNQCIHLRKLSQN